MMLTKAAIDAFINANILFVLAFALWRVVDFTLDRTRLKHAYSVRLQMLNTVFISLALSPVLLIGFSGLQMRGVGHGFNVNLSDAIVSYYLDGGLHMRATEFANLISWRDRFIADITAAAGWGALAAIAAFLTGLIYGIVRLGIAVMCLNSILSNSFEWRHFGCVKICLSDRVIVPFSTRGWRTYYVVIPSHMLGNSQELRVSLAHEFQHIRQGDLIWEIIFEALKPIFFLNPTYHLWKREIEDLRELSCDSQVLIKGRVSLKAYCDTLLSVCQQTLQRDRMFVTAVPKVTLLMADRCSLWPSKVNFLEHRINRLFAVRTCQNARLAYLAIATPLLAVIALSAVAIQRPDDWSHDRLMLSSVVNLERLAAITSRTMFQP